MEKEKDDMDKKLYLSNANRQFLGVCGGIAEYLNVDPTVVRLVWAIGTALTGFILGTVVYVACGFIIPSSSNR